RSAAQSRCAAASFEGRRCQKGQNGNSIRVFGARLLRRLHGRTITDGLLQEKVTAAGWTLFWSLRSALPHSWLAGTPCTLRRKNLNSEASQRGGARRSRM